jgi:hypothetical protein
LFGLFPIIWLPMTLVVIPSQIVAKFVATPRRQILAPNYWHANIGKAAPGTNQTHPQPTRALPNPGRAKFLANDFAAVVWPSHRLKK